MAVSRKLTVRNKRMLGLVVAIIFILYLLKRFYEQGFDQLANALKMTPEQFDGVTDSLSQVGEGFVLYTLLRTTLAKGWVRTVSVWGSLIYAIDGALQLFNIDIAQLFGGKTNG